MRVLVVDDEKRLARSLRVGLEAEGFAVDLAHDGTDGLWLARENEYDAIVLDLMLPGINGYKVCETLRAEKNWTPILMLTAKDGEWDQVEGLDTGADDYLTKPFSFPVLVARLRAVARRGARERPTQLEAGDLRLDPAARRVWRGDVELELTAREFSLLAFLARHQGDVVSKRQILEAVWDVDFVGDPNIVEVYIRHLRNKIDRPFGREAIQTLRGRGLPAGERRWLRRAGPCLGPAPHDGRGVLVVASPCSSAPSLWWPWFAARCATGWRPRPSSAPRRWPTRSRRRVYRTAGPTDDDEDGDEPDELVWQVTDADGTVVRSSQPLERAVAHRGC